MVESIIHPNITDHTFARNEFFAKFYSFYAIFFGNNFGNIGIYKNFSAVSCKDFESFFTDLIGTANGIKTTFQKMANYHCMRTKTAVFWRKPIIATLRTKHGYQRFVLGNSL